MIQDSVRSVSLLPSRTAESGLTLSQFAISALAAALIVVMAYYGGSLMGEGFLELVKGVR